MSNAVGRRAQEAHKCSVSMLLDRVFEGEDEVGAFSIPADQEYMLRAQLSGAQQIGYFPLPDHSIADSLAAGVTTLEPGGDVLIFSPCEKAGWTSQISLAEG